MIGQVSPQQTAVLRLWKTISDRFDAEVAKSGVKMDPKKLAFTKTAVYVQVLTRVVSAGLQSASIDENYLGTVIATANQYAKSDENVRRLSMASFMPDGIDNERLFAGQSAGPTPPSTVTPIRNNERSDPQGF